MLKLLIIFLILFFIYRKISNTNIVDSPIKSNKINYKEIEDVEFEEINKE